MGLFFSFCFTVQSQKKLLGVNKGADDFNPNSTGYGGNISEFNIDGQSGTVVHEFSDFANGKTPKGKLFQASNGKLYGTTNAGGNTFFTTPNGTGVLYEYDLILNKYTVIYYFEDYPGDPPINGVIEPIVGKLYGSIGYKVYSYDLNTEQFTFVNNIFTGASMNNELMKASNNLLYVTTAGIVSCSGTATSVVNGTISKVNTITNNLDIAYYLNCNFSDGYNNGSNPSSLIEAQSGKLYGFVPTGLEFANTQNGLIFEFNINTNTFTKKIDFDGNNLGSVPNCMVNADNIKLYGVCQNGGTNIYIDPNSGNTSTNHYGTLFEYNVVSNTIIKLHDFGNQTNPPNSISGIYPKSIMKASTGFYFGVTDFGLFKFNPIDNSVVMPTPFNCTNCPVNEPLAFVTESLIEICRKPSYQEFVVDTFDACVGSTFTYDVQNTNATSYQWLKNNVNVVGQTTGILNLTNLTANDAGNYTCLMTNECGTTTTMVLHLTVSCLGTNTVASLEKGITMYPNPAKNILNLKLPENIDVNVNSVTIANSLGQIVLIQKTENTTTLDVSQLQKGIYIVSLTTNYGSWNGKFVKE